MILIRILVLVILATCLNMSYVFSKEHDRRNDSSEQAQNTQRKTRKFIEQHENEKKEQWIEFLETRKIFLDFDEQTSWREEWKELQNISNYISLAAKEKSFIKRGFFNYAKNKYNLSNKECRQVKMVIKGYESVDDY